MYVNPQGAVPGDIVRLRANTGEVLTDATAVTLGSGLSLAFTQDGDDLLVTIPDPVPFSAWTSTTIVAHRAGGQTATGTFILYFPGPWVQRDEGWTAWRELSNAGSTAYHDGTVGDVSQSGEITGTPNPGGNYHNAIGWMFADYGRGADIGGNPSFRLAEILITVDLSQLPTYSYPDQGQAQYWDLRFDPSDGLGTVIGPVQVELLPNFSPMDPSMASGSDFVFTARQVTDISMLQLYQDRWWMFQPSAVAADDYWLDATSVAALPEIFQWAVADEAVTKTLALQLSDFLSTPLASGGETNQTGIYSLVVVPTWMLGGSPPPVNDGANVAFGANTGYVPTTARARAWFRPAKYRLIHYKNPVPSCVTSFDGDVTYAPRGPVSGTVTVTDAADAYYPPGVEDVQWTYYFDDGTFVEADTPSIQHTWEQWGSLSPYVLVTNNLGYQSWASGNTVTIDNQPDLTADPRTGRLAFMRPMT